MTHARNRPPTARRGGRPPKGPRPVASKNEQLLTDLRATADHLRSTDKPTLADTVEDLLAPGGWGRLRRAVEADTTAKNFNISIDKAAHVRYQAASEAAGSNLSADVVEGLRAFIDGDFSPANYPRRSAGSGSSTYLNARLADDLRSDFEGAVEARANELGFKTTIGHVVKAYLAHKYAQPAK